MTLVKDENRALCNRKEKSLFSAFPIQFYRNGMLLATKIGICERIFGVRRPLNRN